MATLPAHPPFTPAETGYVWTGSQARTCSAATGSLSIWRRSVLTRTSSGTTVRTTSCARGRTSRNQPTPPAIASTTPRTLTEAAVSRPAKTSVTPAARTMGQAVGAGSSISRAVRSDGGATCGVAMAVSSAPDDVDDGEHDDPDDVDEVPVEGKHADAPGVLPADVSGDGEQRHDRHQSQADDHVQPVQADQRVVRGPEQVGGDGEAVLVDQPVPFLRGAEQERSAERDREQPEPDERAARAALERLAREVDGEAARQQADREQDRRLEHFARGRPAEALAHVVEVGHDEDGEDRGLRDDQAGHADGAAIGEPPVRGRLVTRDRDGAHDAL